MPDQREVIRLARADLERRNILLVEEIRRSPRKRRRDIDQSEVFRVLLERNLVVAGERAFLHDLPDRLSASVGWQDLLGLLGHFVPDEMGLMLDDLAARLRGERHHVARDIQIPAVVDPDLGNDERWFFGADFAVCDLHDVPPR